MDDFRKTAIINKKLARFNIGAVCFQEMVGRRWVPKRKRLHHWQRLSLDETRQHIVGFGVRNSLIATIEILTGGQQDIAGHCQQYLAYALTLTSSPEAKD